MAVAVKQSKGLDVDLKELFNLSPVDIFEIQDSEKSFNFVFSLAPNITCHLVICVGGLVCCGDRSKIQENGVLRVLRMETDPDALLLTCGENWNYVLKRPLPCLVCLISPFQYS